LKEKALLAFSNKYDTGAKKKKVKGKERGKRKDSPYFNNITAFLHQRPQDHGKGKKKGNEKGEGKRKKDKLIVNVYASLFHLSFEVGLFREEEGKGGEGGEGASVFLFLFLNAPQLVKAKE